MESSAETRPRRMKAPLTERILARLPGPRLLWSSAWVALVVVRVFAVFGVEAWVGARPFRLETVRAQATTTLAFAYMVALALWAIQKLGQDAHDVVTAVVARFLVSGLAL